MTNLEIVLSVSSILFAAVSVGYFRYLDKTSGRDHTVDEKRVRKLISATDKV